MSLKEIHFYQAECDNCGKTLEFNSMQFGGDAWYFFPRACGWHVESDGDWLSPWKVLCPRCKDIKVGDAE